MASDKDRAYDAWLVASARLGEREAWNRLVARWQPRFISHAWRLLGHREQAAEAVQDAWLEVFRSLASLDDARAFPAWALRIVSRRCARLVDRQVRQRETERVLVEDADPADERLAGERDSELAAVRRALAVLPAEQRAVIGLFYMQDMSVAEVAVALDIPPGTVKTRLMHARHKLKATLEGESNEQD